MPDCLVYNGFRYASTSGPVLGVPALIYSERLSMSNIQAGRRGTLHEHQANKPVHGREFPPGYLVSDRADKMREQLMAAYVKRIVTEFSPTSAELCKVVQKVCGK
jgi:hypothetical protein